MYKIFPFCCYKILLKSNITVINDQVANEMKEPTSQLGHSVTKYNSFQPQINPFL